MRTPKSDTPPYRAAAGSSLARPLQVQVLPVTQVVSASSIQVVDGQLVVVRLPLPVR